VDAEGSGPVAGGLATLGGVLLALVIVAGTGCYVAGAAPPFPTNAWAFNGALVLCVVYALLFGRASRR
jgi:hypothetical protein